MKGFVDWFYAEGGELFLLLFIFWLVIPSVVYAVTYFYNKNKYGIRNTKNKYGMGK